MTEITYRPAPPINWDALSSIGESIGGGLKQHRLNSALAEAINPDGTIDTNKAAKALILNGNPVAGTALLNRDKITPYQQKALDIQQQALDLRKQGGAGKPPIGYQWADDSDHSKGVTAIPGGPAEKLNQTTAAASAMMDAADKELSSVGPDGKPLISALTKSYDMEHGPAQFEAQSISGQGPIGRAQRAIRNKVEAALRLMTGAAAPQTEVDRYADFYTPKWYDNQDTAQQKLRLLDEFGKGAKGALLRGRGGDLPPLPSQPDAVAQPAPQGPKAPTSQQQQLFEQHKDDPEFLKAWNERFGQ